LNLVSDVTVKVFYRNINDNDTLFYVKFNYDDNVWYLRRFLEQDIILNVLNNVILSINCINNNGEILKKLIRIDPDNYINKYLDNESSDITYIYSYNNSDQIININGVYDRRSVDDLKELGKEDNTGLINGHYVPDDVVLINNTQKTN
jgi:hypothetical protein